MQLFSAVSVVNLAERRGGRGPGFLADVTATGVPIAKPATQAKGGENTCHRNASRHSEIFPKTGGFAEEAEPPLPRPSKELNSALRGDAANCGAKSPPQLKQQPLLIISQLPDISPVVSPKLYPG